MNKEHRFREVSKIFLAGSRSFLCFFMAVILVASCIGIMPAYAASDVSYYADTSFQKQIKSELSNTVKSSGKTYYVATNGRNSWKGSKNKPFATFAYAVSKLKAGDTLYIRGGTYTESIQLSDKVRGTKNKYISIQNYPGEQVLLSGRNRPSAILVRISGSSYVRISGLELAYAEGHNSCGILVRPGSHHIVLRDNEIHDITVDSSKTDIKCANGIEVIGDDAAKSIHDVLIYKNRLYDCKTGWSEAVAVTANCTNINIVENRVNNIDNIGINISGNYGYCDNPAKDFPRKCVVTGNQVSRCVSKIATSYGIYIDGGQQITISDNQVKKCSGGIEVGAEEVPKKEKYATSNIIVKNNVVTNNIRNAITIGGYQQQLGWVKKVKVTQNICKNNGLTNVILTLAKCSNIEITDNVFSNSTGDSDILYSEFSNKYTKNIVFEDNTYYNGQAKGDTSFVYLGKYYASFAQWNRIVGGDAGIYKK